MSTWALAFTTPPSALLGDIYDGDARNAITGVTLIAGFASTVGWPLSSLGLETISWRETCYAWALAHFVNRAAA